MGGRSWAAALALAVLLAAGPARAAADIAGFGLRWGLTVTQVNRLGSPAEREQDLGAGVVEVDLRKLPRSPAGTRLMALAFDSEHGLARLMWFSEMIKDDKAGSTARAAFAEWRTKLSERHGAPVEAAETVAESRDFHDCLARPGCGAWQAAWAAADGGRVTLAIQGLATGAGVLRVTFEGPHWPAIAGRLAGR